MFETTDLLARIIGYGAMAYGVVWVVTKHLNHKSDLRAQQIDREWLEQMRVENPESYEREMAWRSNLDRKKNGLPTDSGFEEEFQRTARSMVEAMREGQEWRAKR